MNSTKSGCALNRRELYSGWNIVPIKNLFVGISNASGTPVGECAENTSPYFKNNCS